MFRRTAEELEVNHVEIEGDLKETFYSDRTCESQRNIDEVEMGLVKKSETNRTGPTTLNSTPVRRQLDFIEGDQNCQKISLARHPDIQRALPRVAEAKIDKI